MLRRRGTGPRNWSAPPPPRPPYKVQYGTAAVPHPAPAPTPAGGGGGGALTLSRLAAVSVTVCVSRVSVLVPCFVKAANIFPHDLIRVPALTLESRTAPLDHTPIKR